MSGLANIGPKNIKPNTPKPLNPRDKAGSRSDPLSLDFPTDSVVINSPQRLNEVETSNYLSFMAEAENLKQTEVKNGEAFHGTTSYSLWKIIDQGGLRVSNGLYGEGVYAAEAQKNGEIRNTTAAEAATYFSRDEINLVFSGQDRPALLRIDTRKLMGKYSIGSRGGGATSGTRIFNGNIPIDCIEYKLGDGFGWRQLGALESDPRIQRQGISGNSVVGKNINEIRLEQGLEKAALTGDDFLIDAPGIISHTIGQGDCEVTILRKNAENADGTFFVVSSSSELMPIGREFKAYEFVNGNPLLDFIPQNLKGSTRLIEIPGTDGKPQGYVLLSPGDPALLDRIDINGLGRTIAKQMLISDRFAQARKSSLGDILSLSAFKTDVYARTAEGDLFVFIVNAKVKPTNAGPGKKPAGNAQIIGLSDGTNEFFGLKGTEVRAYKWGTSPWFMLPRGEGPEAVEGLDVYLQENLTSVTLGDGKRYKIPNPEIKTAVVKVKKGTNPYVAMVGMENITDELNAGKGSIKGVLNIEDYADPAEVDKELKKIRDVSWNDPANRTIEEWMIRTLAEGYKGIPGTSDAEANKLARNEFRAHGYRDTQSGLLTYKVFVKYVAAKSGSGKYMTIVALDGNGLGALGPTLGHKDGGKAQTLIVRERIPAAVAQLNKELEQEGVRIVDFRYAERSDEYFWEVEGEQPYDIENKAKRFNEILREGKTPQPVSEGTINEYLQKLDKLAPKQKQMLELGPGKVTIEQLSKLGWVEKGVSGTYVVDLSKAAYFKDVYYYTVPEKAPQNYTLKDLARDLCVPPESIDVLERESGFKSGDAIGRGYKVAVPEVFAVPLLNDVKMRGKFEIGQDVFKGISLNAKFAKIDRKMSEASVSDYTDVLEKQITQDKLEVRGKWKRLGALAEPDPRADTKEQGSQKPEPEVEVKQGTAAKKAADPEAKPGSKINLSNSAMFFGFPLLMAGLEEMDQGRFDPRRFGVNVGLGTGTALAFSAVEKRMISSGPSGAAGTAGALIALPMSVYSNWKDLSSLDPTKTGKGLVNVTADTEIGAFTGGIMPYVGLWGSMVVGAQAVGIKNSVESNWAGLTSSEAKKTNDAQSAVVWDSTVGWMKSPVESIHGLVSGSVGKTSLDLVEGNGFHPVNNYQAKKEDAKVAFNEAGKLLDEKGATQWGKNRVADVNWSVDKVGGWAFDKIDEIKNTLLSKEEASKALASGGDGVELKFGEDYKLDKGESVLGATAKDLDLMGEIMRGNYGVKAMSLDGDAVLNDFMRDSIMAAVRDINAEQPIKNGEVHISYKKKTGKTLLSISVFNDGSSFGKRVFFEAGPNTVGGNITKGERLPGIINVRK